MQDKVIKFFFKLRILFLNIAISIFLIIDLITNWIMLKISDRQIAFIAGIITFVFFGGLLISVILKITQMVIVYCHTNHYNKHKCELKGFLIAFSVLLTPLIILLIIRNLAWFNPTWTQLFLPQIFATILLFFWIIYFCSEAATFEMT